MNYYDENLIKYIDASVVLHPLFDEWMLIVEEILLNKEFQKRKLFMHHHNLSVWDHSILVSFRSFELARFFGADERVCAIAGLLHDFYSQVWLSTPEVEELEGGKYATLMKEKKPFYKMHAFTHANDASLNYVKFFPQLENKKITNSIKRHMFPLTLIPPRYKEGFIITIVDKFNSVHELPSLRLIPKIVKDKAYKLFFKKN